MIALKEIRLKESAPNIGAEVFANRRTTSTFLVGAEGVVDITLDGFGCITVTTEKGTMGVPAAACLWWKFADPVVVDKPVEPEKKPSRKK